MQTDSRQSRLAYFFSQPHQPFFTWGVINAIVMMLLFLLAMKGVVVFRTLTPALFHGYTLIYIVFTAFFQGFLLTTFVRFSQMPPLEQKIYTTNFTLLFSATLLFLSGIFFSKTVMITGMVLLAGNQIYTFYIFYQIYRASPSPDKFDQFWIMSAFFAGIVTNFMMILLTLIELPRFETAALRAGLYLYVVFVALSVGQRMIPFFSHVMIEKNRKLYRVIFLLFLLAVAAESFQAHSGFLFLAIAGILLTKEIHRWRLPFRDAPPILWILHLAIFWLPTGLIAGALADGYALISGKNLLFLSIHLVALGFVTTVLIGFGTRVTLGHSGNMMVTDAKTKILFYLTQIVVYMRLLYSITATPFLFDITVVLWIVLFGGWAIKYMPALAFGKRVT